MAQQTPDCILRWDHTPLRLIKAIWPGALSAFGHLSFLASAMFFGSPSASAAPDDERLAPLAAFQEKEDRLFRTGFRLARSNVMFCDRQENSLGLLIHDVRSYSKPQAVRSFYGLSGDIGIQSVADASPAKAAGLAQNDTLVSVDTINVAELPVSPKGDWTRGAVIADLLRAKGEESFATLAWINDSGESIEAKVARVPVCASRFELQSGRDNAAADGKRVLVGNDFPGFDYPEDEFAAILAHEMAHNILGHLQARKAKGRNKLSKRETEREADRLMPWLLANAGYDPAAAVRMMERWGPRHGGGLFRKRSHDGWDERRDMIEAELPAIEKAQELHPQGAANWLTRFDNGIAKDQSEG